MCAKKTHSQATISPNLRRGGRAWPPVSKLRVLSPPLLVLLEPCAKLGPKQTGVSYTNFQHGELLSPELARPPYSDVLKSARTGGA